MLNWSLRFILKISSNPDFVYASLVVASLNMLIQILLDAIFVRKEWSKLGGWIK